MDDLLSLLINFTQQVEQYFDELSDEEAAEINNFITQTMEFITDQQQGPAEAPPTGPIEAEPPMGADLLWILAGGQEDAFVNYLRTYPNPELNALIRNPTQLQSVIQRLQQTMPQGGPQSQGGIEKAPLNSSNIYGFQYNPKSGKLMVRFQGGSVYAYDGVPPGIFQVFQQGAVPARTKGKNRYGQWWQGKIPSLGAAFHQLIKQGNYPYRRLS